MTPKTEKLNSFNKYGISFNYKHNYSIDFSHLERIGFLKLHNKSTIFTIQIVPLNRYKSVDDLKDKLKMQVIRSVNDTENGFIYDFHYLNQTYSQRYEIIEKNNYYLVYTLTSKKANEDAIEEYKRIKSSTKTDKLNLSFIKMPLDIPITIYGANREERIKNATEEFIKNYKSGDKLIVKAPHFIAVYTLTKKNTLIDLNNIERTNEEIIKIILNETSPLDKVKMMALYLIS